MSRVVAPRLPSAFPNQSGGRPMSAGFKGRREDLRLVTGRGKYTSDWNLPGQLHGSFLRSDRAHAEIVSLDTSPARASSGVVAVFTGADTARAGFKSTPQLARYPGRGGATIKVPHRDGLANGRVRFVGQEVALVVAKTALAAQDAAEKIEVEYRDLPAVVDAEAALGPGAEQLYPEIPGNLCFDYEYGDEAGTDSAFAQAAHLTRITLDSKRMVGNPMEPKACLAAYDAASDKYDLYVSSQGLSLMRGSASGITGIPAARIMVHAQDVGGGFGIRSDAYAEYCVAMLAAKSLGRPVKWTSSRSETFLSDYHGRAAKLTGELALDKEGRFLAIRINWIVNTGAYLSTPGPLINTLPPGLHAINLYRIPVMYGRHRLALTNTTPTTAYRGAGRPNVCYLAERLVEEAARETGIERLELRRRNLIPKDAFPYQTPHPRERHRPLDRNRRHRGEIRERARFGRRDPATALLSQRRACRRGRDRLRDRRRPDPALHRRGRLRPDHQSRAARRPAARRHRAGHRAGDGRARRLRQGLRPASHRHVHGLRNTPRGRYAGYPALRPLDTLPRQSARREGRGRGGHDRRRSGRRERGDRRAAASRHPPSRFPVYAGSRLARDPGGEIGRRIGLPKPTLNVTDPASSFPGGTQS